MWFEVLAPALLIGAIGYLCFEIMNVQSLMISLAVVFLGAIGAMCQASALDFFARNTWPFFLEVVVIGSLAQMAAFVGMAAAHTALEAARRK